MMVQPTRGTADETPFATDQDDEPLINPPLADYFRAEYAHAPPASNLDTLPLATSSNPTHPPATTPAPPAPTAPASSAQEKLGLDAVGSDVTDDVSFIVHHTPPSMDNYYHHNHNQPPPVTVPTSSCPAKDGPVEDGTPNLSGVAACAPLNAAADSEHHPPPDIPEFPAFLDTHTVDQTDPNQSTSQGRAQGFHPETIRPDCTPSNFPYPLPPPPPTQLLPPPSAALQQEQQRPVIQQPTGQGNAIADVTRPAISSEPSSHTALPVPGHGQQPPFSTLNPVPASMSLATAPQSFPNFPTTPPLPPPLAQESSYQSNTFSMPPHAPSLLEQGHLASSSQAAPLSTTGQGSLGAPASLSSASHLLQTGGMNAPYPSAQSDFHSLYPFPTSQVPQYVYPSFQQQVSEMQPQQYPYPQYPQQTQPQIHEPTSGLAHQVHPQLHQGQPYLPSQDAQQFPQHAHPPTRSLNASNDPLRPYPYHFTSSVVDSGTGLAQSSYQGPAPVPSVGWGVPNSGSQIYHSPSLHSSMESSSSLHANYFSLGRPQSLPEPLNSYPSTHPVPPTAHAMAGLSPGPSQAPMPTQGQTSHCQKPSMMQKVSSLTAFALQQGAKLASAGAEKLQQMKNRPDQ